MPLECTLKSGYNTSQGESKMLKRGSIVLSIWSGINFVFAALILTSVVIFKANSPILALVFEKYGNARWQLYVVLSALYVVGIGLAGYSIFKRQTHITKQPGILT